MSKRLIKQVFKEVRKANSKYNLIDNNDVVGVGMSGGKDSNMLLYFLYLLKKHTPIAFEIKPIYIDLGFNNEIHFLNEYCINLNTELYIKKTNIGEIVFEIRKEKNPCSLCANMRRGALNNTAKELGCNKVALGHHLDDVVNTWLMSILYENRYNVFKPKTYLDRIDITVIRPLIYVPEQQIYKIFNHLDFKTVINNCPAEGATKRDEISNLVKHIEEKYPEAKKNILYSLENVNENSFWKN
ncbi:MAG: tRNA 2-thiocytidine biosynthesis protein TtcA [Syntrophomonadaceae bacterium]|nr:tRNA 2-thiocytidine biosynthesis protein TtcA [Syntrophomonadaceae bacterium]